MATAVEHEATFCKASTPNRFVKDVAYRLVIDAAIRFLAREEPVLTGSAPICLMNVIDQNAKCFF